MSALLATASATFSYQGASVTLSCTSATELLEALRSFGIGQAANDSAAPGKSKPAATAPAGASAAPTAAPSAPNAAAPAVQGEAGNGAGAPKGEASAPPASSGTSTGSSASGDELPADPKVAFDIVKKAFLALATKPNGRALCEEVNKKFGVAKLSDNKPENYAAVLAEIKAKAA